MQIVCERCGYVWDYQGDAYQIKCPSCSCRFMSDVVPDMRGRTKGRTIEPINLPTGMEEDSAESNKWMMFQIRKILATRSLTPTDIKILNDLRETLKILDYMVRVSKLEERVNKIEGRK